MRINRIRQLRRHWPTSEPDYQWPQSGLGAAQSRAGRFALSGVFHLFYALGCVLAALKHSRPSALLIRTDGIGDAILFEPALETLARSLSPHELHLWAPRATCDLMRACPVIRRRIAIPRGFKEGNLLVLRSPFWRAKIGFHFGFNKFEVAIYPAESPEPLGSWLFANVRAHARWINYGDTINQFEWQRVKTQERATRVLSNRPGAAHELTRNAYLSTQWGGSLELRKPKLYLTAKAIANADREMLLWRHSERHVRGSGVVAIIASGSQKINRYPADKWVTALQELWRQHRALPAFLGGAAEESFIQAIVEQLGEVPHVRPARPLDVLTTTALVGRVDAIIAVDTGFAHAALAQGTPSIIIRIGGDPGRFLPWPMETRSAVLFKPMSCEGCHNRCHLSEAKCITDVTPEEIVAAYARLAVSRSVVEYASPAARWMKVAG